MSWRKNKAPVIIVLFAVAGWMIIEFGLWIIAVTSIQEPYQFWLGVIAVLVAILFGIGVWEDCQTKNRGEPE
jgi:hypothetical protein